MHKIELRYHGKESENTILKNTYEYVMIENNKLQSKRNIVSSKSTDLYNTNVLIEGDNLIAMKILLNEFNLKGKVSLVYIDPPFSTNQTFKKGIQRTATISKSNQDDFAYDDLLDGNAYLEFIRKRLIILRELLSSDGSIYVHVSLKMSHYIRVLMDEIFGADNFVNEISRIKCNPKNFHRKAFGNIKDVILFYSKTKKRIWNDPRVPLKQEDIERLFPKVDANGRRYTTTPLHAPGETKNGATGQPWRNLMPPSGRHWRYPPEELEKLDQMGLIEWSQNGVPRKIIYADEVSIKGKKMQDVWEFKDPPYPRYPTEKNIDMLKLIIEASTNPGDIVLDCFAGSGTTLVAAEELGRRWIGIDNSPVAINVIRERLDKLKTTAMYKLLNIVRLDDLSTNSDNYVTIL